jgi:hypothetical protein
MALLVLVRVRVRVRVLELRHGWQRTAHRTFVQMYKRVVGVSCTAALASLAPRRGAHHCCIAVCNDDGVSTYSVTLRKGRRDRGGEDDAVTRLLLYAMVDGVNAASAADDAVAAEALADAGLTGKCVALVLCCCLSSHHTVPQL